MGVLGFGLYLLYDIDSFAGLGKPFRLGFALGTALIGASTLIQLIAAWRQGAFSGAVDAALLLLCLLSLGALVYCLFFALPFKDTYTSPETGRHTYTCGAYALCRHPGILCFFAVYLFLGLAALPTDLLRNGMIFSGLNLAYAWFQDRVTFPKTFCDYPAYREQTPFLFPTPESIRRAGRTWGHSFAKEEQP